MTNRICLLAAVSALVLSCNGDPMPRLTVSPLAGGSELVISGPPEIGDLLLWVPEAIMSERGASAMYPLTEEWQREGNVLSQHAEGDGVFGRDCRKNGEETLDCIGVPVRVDSPVEWDTVVEVSDGSIDFSIELTNVGDTTIRKAAASVHLKFMNGDWWADENVYVISGGEILNLAEIGRDGGADNVFQVYLLNGQSFNSRLYYQIWGVNRRRLDRPIMVSEHRAAGWRVSIEGGRAYFLHSSKANPCTDVMLAFGDLKPGASATVTGSIRIQRGGARAQLAALLH